mmetsp:Transcript_11650/g.49819  ORF Transcript_11650/g.49819 Transcript_11650/m.49819 type:complete len:216 (+) Transcript_11650:2248-2895(+)
MTHCVGSVCAATTCRLRGKPATGRPPTLTRTTYDPLFAGAPTKFRSPSPPPAAATNATSSGPTASTRTLYAVLRAAFLSSKISSSRSSKLAGLPKASRASTETVASRPAIATSMPPGLSFAPARRTTHFARSGAAAASETESGAPGSTSRAKPPHHRRCDSAAKTRNEYTPASSARKRATDQGACGFNLSGPTSASTAPGPSPSATTTRTSAASA